MSTLTKFCSCSSYNKAALVITSMICVLLRVHICLPFSVFAKILNLGGKSLPLQCLLDFFMRTELHMALNSIQHQKHGNGF